MIKISKKLFGVLVGTTILIAGITAFANTGSYYFELYPGASQYSSSVKKTNTYQAASANIYDSSNLRAGDQMYFRVRRTSDDKAMTETRLRDQGGFFTLDYTSTGVNGTYYRLKGQQGSTPSPSFIVIGDWTP